MSSEVAVTSAGVLRAVSFAVLVAGLAGCVDAPATVPTGSQTRPTAGSRSPELLPTPQGSLSGISMSKALAYAAVQREVREFLEMWRTQGYGPASAAYLVPEQQGGQAELGPLLTAGRVVTVDPVEWLSVDEFVVEVDLDLAFSGNSGAWGPGRNSRFVTARSRAGAIPYVLELATSR